VALAGNYFDEPSLVKGGPRSRSELRFHAL
jgi:hypothetical protein